MLGWENAPRKKRNSCKSKMARENSKWMMLPLLKPSFIEDFPTNPI
jgi:hypothetical protein